MAFTRNNLGYPSVLATSTIYWKESGGVTILLFLLIGLYHISVLGWVGVSRYSVPSLICISLFFANGVFGIKLFHEKNNFNSLFKRK